MGIVFTRAGLGRRTRQYNPSSEGARNLGEWMNAVMSMKGESGGNMDVSDAVEMIHNTSPEQRSRFARHIWQIRRKKRTDTTILF